MTSELNYILSFQLATNQDLVLNYNQIKQTLDSTTPNSIQRAILQHGTTSPTVHRWCLRILSLLDPKLASSTLSRSYSLLLTTFQSSPYLLTKHATTILQPTLNILYKPRPDRELFEIALQVVLLVLARGQERPEWLRELVGGQGQNNGVQRVVRELVKKLQDDTLEELHPSSLTALNILLPLFPTQLRPLSPLLHALTISLLCLPTPSPFPTLFSESAAQLYSNLYLLAPKGKEGLKESWRLSAESLVGSMWECQKLATLDAFTEDLSIPPPPPLSLPPLTPSTPSTALHRLTTLSSALLTLLRTPTTPLATSVPIPISHLLSLSLHLISLTPESPQKITSSSTLTSNRMDENTLKGIYQNLPRMNVIGAQIGLQLACILPPPILSRHSPEIFSSLQLTLETPSVDRMTKSVLRRCWAEIGRCLAGCVNGVSGTGGQGSGEGEARGLSRVWRGVLEDLGGVWVKDGVEEDGEDKIGEDEESKRKKKRQKTFDPDAGSNVSGSAHASARLTSGELEIVLRALETLEILISIPLSHFLPPKLHQATLHLLLSISLSPTFTSSHTPSTSLTPNLQPLYTKSPTQLSLFCSHPSFRLLLLRCLSALEKSESLAIGSEEFLRRIWGDVLKDSSSEIRAIAMEGLGEMRKKLRPVMPGISRNLRLNKERSERIGGELGGMEQVMEEGQGWGRARDQEEEKVEEGEEEIEEVLKEEKVEVVKTFADIPSLPPSASASSTTSTPRSFGAAFAAFSSTKSAPAVPEKVAPPPSQIQTETQLDVAISSMPTTQVVETNADRGVRDEEDSSDGDDETLPQILMDSDDDEE